MIDYAIIAAGQGSRLAEDGEISPKPLVCLDDEPMIARLIHILSRSCARQISVIVSTANSDVAECVKAVKSEVPVQLISRSTSGSMESFAELSKVMERTRPFCLLTVDSVFLPDEFQRFIRDFEADTEADGYMGVTSYIDDEKPLYIAAAGNGEITAFLDSPNEGAVYVSGGIYALRPEVFAVLDDCVRAGVTRMRDFQRALVASGMRLKAWPFSRIIDVDHGSDLEKARSFVGKPPQRPVL